MEPKITVIIPTYNGHKYIAKAIESALNQTERNIEIIVVDDNSSDGTVAIVKSFHDKRLILIENKTNRGIHSAINCGLRKTAGEWVTILDHDDWYLSERLEKLLSAACAVSADFIADDQYFIKEGQSTSYRTLFSVAGKYIDKLQQVDTLEFVESDKRPARKSPHFGLTKPLMRRSFLVKHALEFNEQIDYVGDFYIDMMCLLKKGRFLILPEPLYYHRVHKGQYSQQNKEKQLKFLRWAVLDLIQRESSSMTAEVKASLYDYIPILNHDINYFRVIALFKRVGILRAFFEMARHPQFLMLFIQQSPRILHRLIFGYI